MKNYDNMYYEYKRKKYEEILKNLKKSIDKLKKVWYNNNRNKGWATPKEKRKKLWKI